MPQQSVYHFIRKFSRRFNLDPRAVAAVALSEGGLGWGAVGDQGTSFGPFQLHVGGALPQGRGEAWANSKAGVRYALRQMAGAGAAGLSGQSAISAIVRNFERPADPTSEIQRAIQHYTQFAGSGLAGEHYGSSSAYQASPVQFSYQPNATPSRQLTALGMLDSLDPVLQAAIAKRLNLQYSPTSAAHTAGGATSWSGEGLNPALVQLASRFGLDITSGVRSVAQNKAVGGVPDSYHLSGQAVDVAPNVGNFNAFIQFAQSHAGMFKEFFYDPLGWYIKNGQIYQGAIGGHGDHLHYAL